MRPQQFHSGKSRPQSNQRAQLILLIGFILTTTLILLAVLLNGLLFTENLSTQQQPQEIDRAGEITATINSTAQDLIKKENKQQHETEIAVEDFKNNIEKLHDLISTRQFEAHGQQVRIRNSDTQGAWVITQEEPSTLTPESGTILFNVWSVVSANGVRDGEITITDATERDSTTPSTNDHFRMIVTGTNGLGNTSELYIYEESSGEDIVFTTDFDNKQCIASPPATINFTSITTLNGGTCAIDLFENITQPNYEILYQRGINATGTYRFIAGQGNSASLGGSPSSNVIDAVNGETPQENEPVAYDGVYEAEVTLGFESVDFESTTTIMPIPIQELPGSPAPQFNPADGNDVSNEVESKGINNGKCTEGENVCESTGTFKRGSGVSEIDGFTYIENTGSVSSVDLDSTDIDGALVVNAGQKVGSIDIDGSDIKGDIFIKAHSNNADVDVDIDSGIVEGDVKIDSAGSVDLDVDKQKVQGTINESADLNLSKPQ